MPSNRRTDARELFNEYVAMGPTRSYQALGDAHGIGKATITRIAVKDGWLGRLRAIEEEARRAADQKLADTRAEMYERHIKLAKFVQSKALQGLQQHSFDAARDAAKALIDGVKLERTAAGEPNEHQTISVQALTRREVESLVTGSLFDERDNEDVAAEAEVGEVADDLDDEEA